MNENVYINMLKEEISGFESSNVVDETTKVVNESKDVNVHKSKGIVHKSEYVINENFFGKSDKLKIVESDC